MITVDWCSESAVGIQNGFLGRGGWTDRLGAVRVEILATLCHDHNRLPASLQPLGASEFTARNIVAHIITHLHNGGAGTQIQAIDLRSALHIPTTPTPIPPTPITPTINDIIIRPGSNFGMPVKI